MPDEGVPGSAQNADETTAQEVDVSALAERPAPQLSGVAEAVHTWAGRFGALLVLTQHGALLERPAADERWTRLGRYVTGEEAQAIADRKGYDHVGFDSTVNEYVPPGVLLALVPPIDSTTTTEGTTTVSAAAVEAPSGASEADVQKALPRPSERPPFDKPSMNAAASRRLRAILELIERGGTVEQVDAVVDAWAEAHNMAWKTVRSPVVKTIHERGGATPWDLAQQAEQAANVEAYHEIERRRAAGEPLNVVAQEIADRLGRKVGGVKQTYSLWRAVEVEAGRLAPPEAAKRTGGAKPARRVTKNIRGPKPRQATPAVVRERVTPPAPAELRVLLGVQAVASDDLDAVAQVRETLDGMGDALRVTWRAIPTAKKILEGEIEQLMQRLEDLDGEAGRVRQVAELLGVDLEAEG